MRATPRMPEFLAPLPLCAVALMAVNDRWLKPAFHNALTGKLSDVAICFFLPLYVSALLALVTRWSPRWRVGVGAVFTAALFTVLKVSPAGAALFCQLLRPVGALLGFESFRAVVDPTDLIALPLVGAAVHYGLASQRTRAIPPNGVET